MKILCSFIVATSFQLIKKKHVSDKYILGYMNNYIIA